MHTNMIKKKVRQSGPPSSQNLKILVILWTHLVCIVYIYFDKMHVVSFTKTFAAAKINKTLKNKKMDTLWIKRPNEKKMAPFYRTLFEKLIYCTSRTNDGSFRSHKIIVAWNSQRTIPCPATVKALLANVYANANADQLNANIIPGGGEEGGNTLRFSHNVTPNFIRSK